MAGTNADTGSSWQSVMIYREGWAKPGRVPERAPAGRRMTRCVSCGTITEAPVEHGCPGRPKEGAASILVVPVLDESPDQGEGG